MGCFLACFGFKEKKKRRKPGKKTPSGEEQDHRSYVPLDSDVSIKLDIKEHITSHSNQLKEKPKEPAIQKIKKKVTFNLNVKAYEPIPDYDDDDDDDIGVCLSEGEEETKWELKSESKSMATLHYEEEDAKASSTWSYPATHRYQNCRDSYDEEDNEFKLEENDLQDFDEIEDSDDEDADDQDDDGMLSQEIFPWELNPVMVKSENELTSNTIGEAENTNLEHFLDSQTTKELQGLESKSNVRDRRQYVSSVLNPVENLSQWKVVKAKAATPQFKYQKENSMTKQKSTISADASLSNWLETTSTKISRSNNITTHI